MLPISACLVVYNEEAVIERCLASIAPFVSEIIIVHDGLCSDQTLVIAARYTNKIFIREHIGIAEPHRSFTYQQAAQPWILQVDADEFVDAVDGAAIQELVDKPVADGYYWQWELWNGKQPITFKGLQKMVLFKKASVSFQGIPQTDVTVRGSKKVVPITLHHRPVTENVSWHNANRKRRYWLQSHVPYFFPEKVTYHCFQTTPDSWIAYTNEVRRHPWWYIVGYPIKNMLGQLKNGLWSSGIGWSLAFQQYVYYVALYYAVWRTDSVPSK